MKSPYEGFLSIFEIAKRTEAKVIVVSDSDTKSIESRWRYDPMTPVLNPGYVCITP